MKCESTRERICSLIMRSRMMSERKIILDVMAFVMRSVSGRLYRLVTNEPYRHALISLCSLIYLCTLRSILDILSFVTSS